MILTGRLRDGRRNRVCLGLLILAVSLAVAVMSGGSAVASVFDYFHRYPIKASVGKPLRERVELGTIDYEGSMDDVEIEYEDLPEGLKLLPPTRSGKLYLAGTPEEAFSGRVQVDFFAPGSGLQTIYLIFEITGGTAPPPPEPETDPVITSWSLDTLEGRQGEQVSRRIGTIRALDDTDGLRLVLCCAPAGLDVTVIGGTDLYLEGTPEEAGTFEDVTLVLTLPDHPEERRQGTVIVIPPKAAPTVDVLIDQPLALTMRQRIDRRVIGISDDGPDDALMWEMMGTLPRGMSLTGDTALRLEGRPEEAGNFQIIVLATDADGMEVSARLTLDVTESNEPVRANLLQERLVFTEGDEIDLAVAEFSDDGPLEDVTLRAVGLPSSFTASLDPRREQIRLTGSASQEGEYTVFFELTDSNDETTTLAGLRIEVQPAPPRVATAPLPRSKPDIAVAPSRAGPLPPGCTPGQPCANDAYAAFLTRDRAQACISVIDVSSSGGEIEARIIADSDETVTATDLEFTQHFGTEPTLSYKIVDPETCSTVNRIVGMSHVDRLDWLWDGLDLRENTLSYSKRGLDPARDFMIVLGDGGRTYRMVASSVFADAIEAEVNPQGTIVIIAGESPLIATLLATSPALTKPRIIGLFEAARSARFRVSIDLEMATLALR